MVSSNKDVMRLAKRCLQSEKCAGAVHELLKSIPKYTMLKSKKRHC